MRICLDYASSTPMYEQIKNIIKENIYNGTLKNNDALPSIRQLSKEIEVSMITIKRAYMELEHEGLIYTVSGKGTFVKIADASTVLESHQNELLKELRKTISKLKSTNITQEELITLIVHEYEE